MYKQKPLIHLFTMCLTFTLFVSCSVQDSNLSEQIGHLMDRYHEVGLFKGAVLVSHKNEIVYARGYGKANREWHIQNTVDTKFRLGSATKPFTAVLTMKLAEEGMLDLSGKVSDYLPDYRTDTGTQISIRNLLTHSSGIRMPKQSNEEYWDFFRKEWSTDELVKQLCEGDLAFEPGSQFRYSSAGYILLGAIIEAVTGKSYERVLSDYILTPYNLEGTGVDDPEKILPKRASGYQTNYGLGNARYKYMPGSHGSGSMYSTVRDLYLWDQLLRSDFLNNKSKKSMFSPQVEHRKGSFGYGWFIKTVGVDGAIQTRVYHGGDVSGFCAFYVRVLETGDFVALLSNQEGLNYYDIAFTLLDLLNGITPEDPKEYLSDLLRITYYSAGLEKMKAKYSSLKAKGLENFSVIESEILELGYDILRVGNKAAAIAVFKINVEIHPNSALAFDCLGDGFFAIEDWDTAMENYQKALKIDPENKNAKKMIEAIRKKQKQ